MGRFNFYNIHNAEELIKKEIPQNKQDDYKFKKLYRKDDKSLILNKKSFDKFRDEFEQPVCIVGRIRKRQRRYKDYEDYKELVEKKNDKKIYGKASLLFCSYKNYDVKEDAERHIYGYAWVGGNNFIKVITFNPLWLLIPLILCVLLGLLLRGCPNDYNPIDVIDNPSIITEDKPTTTKNAPLCYYIPFNETTEISKDKTSINLVNVKENEGNYYISFKVYIDGKLQKLKLENNTYFLAKDNEENTVTSTALLPPNKQVALNLYDGLEKGSKELTVVATDYDYKTINDIKENDKIYSNRKKADLQQEATKTVTHTFKTSLIVNK